jgi:hypothetical protein
MECVIETKASIILQFLHGLREDLHVTFEEGTRAAWLYDLLKPHVPEVVVCNPPRPDREPVLLGQTKTLGSRTRSIPAHANAPSPAARIEFQSVSVETSPPFPEDVNRAK